MIRVLVYLMFMAGLPLNLYSQGFNWQYDPRLPSQTPYGFTEIGISYGVADFNGNISILESNIYSGEFYGKSGISLSLNLGAEIWTDGVTAFTGGIIYNRHETDFTDTETLPHRTGGITFNVTYGKNIDMSLGYLGLYGKIKRRFPGSHLHASAGIALGLLIKNKLTYNEEILDSERPFTYSDGTTQFHSDDVSLSGVNTYFLLPEISLGYDISLWKGTYFTPQLNFAYPLPGVSSDHSMNRMIFTAGFSFKHSILYSY